MDLIKITVLIGIVAVIAAIANMQWQKNRETLEVADAGVSIPETKGISTPAIETGFVPVVEAAELGVLAPEYVIERKTNSLAITNQYDDHIITTVRNMPRGVRVCTYFTQGWRSAGMGCTLEPNVLWNPETRDFEFWKLGGLNPYWKQRK